MARTQRKNSVKARSRSKPKSTPKRNAQRESSGGDPESQRLAADATREANWKRWGPYLSERQWGTVREDYSADGNCWNYFTHDHARSRTYRWGEDGLLGICDRQCRLCFALALWNGRDPILKERLFGLDNREGNHGEDVKECYFYLDCTPTHSYMKAVYKYPHAEFPYVRLIEENAARGLHQPEFELTETGIFDDGRYFDVVAEYAKASSNDLLIRITVSNRGPEAAPLHLLPTMWFRNTWSWGRTSEGYAQKPRIARIDDATLAADHTTLGRYELSIISSPREQQSPEFVFTDNETNAKRFFGRTDLNPYVKDGFHEYVIQGREDAVNPALEGTKAAALYRLNIPAGGECVIEMRLHRDGEGPSARKMTSAEFDRAFATRKREADLYFNQRLPKRLTDEERAVARQAYAGLLWSKQFYFYVVNEWLEGDPLCDSPPPQRRTGIDGSGGRNSDWHHLYNRDVISMPDKWEFPWYAAWDLAFHMIPFAHVDPEFAKQQLLLMLREWYMHPNGQIPAYEFAFGDVNPPVHAWACWRVYKMTGPRGKRDREFLARAFQKLTINFTWWVNRKDIRGAHLFSGGFLGLDNIGVFDRSKPLPGGGHLEQADGTAWMAFYCGTMLAIALELASEDPAYEDVASKFFEHFVAIIDAINTLGGDGLWNEHDGFYYDQIHTNGTSIPLKLRSMVGLIPLFAVVTLENRHIDALHGFRKRMNWFLENQRNLARHISFHESSGKDKQGAYLLSIASQERLERVLGYLLNEKEFLSPHGIRSLSRVHAEQPFVFEAEGVQQRVDYEPGESTTRLFGGNSNWRGPIWFPVNYLLIEALERYHHFFGDSMKVECPTGSGNMLTLNEVADEIRRRLARLFLPDADGRRPWQGDAAVYSRDPHWRNLQLFHEHFHGDSGRGLGASHQTGWTALIAPCLEDIGKHRESRR